MQALWNCQRWSALAALLVVAAAALLCDPASGSPMMYRKNTDQKYEADLVAVSSTVIPLTALEVSYGVGGQPSEEYKLAYLKKLRKKVGQRAQHAAEGGHRGTISDADAVDAPDTLITINNKKKAPEHRAATPAAVAEGGSADVKDATASQ